MLFRIISKLQFEALIELLMRENEVVGPKVVGHRADGRPIHQYLPLERFEDLDLGYEKTEYSAKTYFLPFAENLCRFRFEGDDWQQEVRYRIQPRALVGLHTCDIEALLKLDQVMLRGVYPSPYYKARRDNTFIIGIDDAPCENGFCSAVGADTVTHGFDLFLTDLGDRYFVAIDSDRGFRLVSEIGAVEVGDSDRRAYGEARRALAKGNGRGAKVDTKNLPTLLDIEFDSPVWQRWGDKCLSCGSCAMVCPTCYCYGIHEDVEMDFSASAKVKQLHSCNLHDFAEVAGAHNFRPTRGSRLKYRYYHQHRGFAEAYDEPKCVGCNRCGDVCLAGISPPKVIGDLQREEDE